MRLPNGLSCIGLGLLGLLLSGCLSTGKPTIDQVRDSLDSGNGMVMIGYSSSLGFWGLDIRRIDPATGELETYERDDVAANGVAFFEPQPPQSTHATHYQSFVLEPGEYAITSIGRRQPGGAVYVPDFGGTGGGGGAGAGLVALAVVAGMTATALAAKAAEDAEFGPPERPPLQFVVDSALVDDAPRFQIRPGHVAYIGDILVSAKVFTVDSIREPARIGEEPMHTTLTAANPMVEYLRDPVGARAELQKLGLSEFPLRTVTIAALAEGPVYVSPTMTRERIEWRSRSARAQTTISEEMVYARPDLPRPLKVMARASGPSTLPPTQAPSPAAAGGPVDQAELRRRFLSGEITREDYEALRHAD